MKRTLGICLLALICTVALASPVVESEVKARGEEFAAAWNKHDAKAMTAIFAPDADLMNPAGRWANGSAEILKLFTEEQSTFMKTSTYKNVKTMVRPLAGDMAVADWNVELTGMMTPDGKPAPVQKVHVTALMKKSGGKWWVVSGRAFAEPAPPPAHS